MLNVLFQQRGGGRVEPLDTRHPRTSGSEGGADRASQRFPQLHAPLVEGVETPHEALHRHTVFVQCQQLAAGERGQFLEQQRQARTVARESFVGMQ